MKEVVTPEDLAFFRKANTAVTTAQTLQTFVYGHLNEVYAFGQGDTFDPTTGAITRAASASPTQPAEPEPPQ